MFKLKSFLLIALLSISLQDHCLATFEKCVPKNPQNDNDEQAEPDNKIGNCLYYDEVEEGKCIGCRIGYAVTFDGSQCISFPNCGLLKEGNKKCKECYEYFHPNSNGQCERTLCEEFEGNVCKSCYNGYFLNNNKECEKITIPYCIKLDSDGKCEECVNHDKGNDQGTCNIPATLIKGCMKYDKDGKCIQCNNDYNGPDGNGNCVFKDCEEEYGKEYTKTEYCAACQVGYDFDFESGECVAIDGSNDTDASTLNKVEYAALIFILALLI